MLFAMVAGPRIVGALSVLVAPPLPPLPPSAEQIAHENLAHGVDRWTYDSDLNVCELAVYYENAGGQCPVRPPICGGGPESTSDVLLSCEAIAELPVFSMRWLVEVPEETGTTAPAHFDILRVVSWSGTVTADQP